MRPYFGGHNHTAKGSNLRLLDSINTVRGLVNKALEFGLSGIAITDHECLSVHPEANQIQDELIKNGSTFKIALGNEIYLTDTRDSGQKYYHFILIAKDATGHRMLRELSSTAWFYSYYDKMMERVPTLKSELSNIITKFGKGHLIATSACIGGELSVNTLVYKKTKDNDKKVDAYNKICNFVQYCLDLFGDDFYIECAPSSYKDQMVVNRGLYDIAKCYNIKMTIGTDAHYLTKEDREVHKAYLNSKGGDREVDDFYEFARLMDSDEVEELLNSCFPAGFVDTLFENTLEIQNKIEYYSLFHKQDIPSVEVKDYPKNNWWGVNNSYADEMERYPNLKKLFMSDDIQNRYWINQCWDALMKKFNCETNIDLIDEHQNYVNELEEEARVKSVISEKLETNMFRYPNTLQHYIDLIWECGSMVGAGRGSSCAALNHYLMGITQLDPIEWNLPFFRYMNDERVELGDIDIDICPSKRPLILQKIREERSHMINNDAPQWAKDNLGCTLVATFGTETTKSAILTACRGYRDSENSEGIDISEAQYMSSLIPQERGFLWPLHDVIEGNDEKNRYPVNDFIRAVDKYPGLLNIMQSIEGLVNKRSSHASGVIFFDGDPFEHCAFMKTPKGEIITQFDLHQSEWMGLTKYDFLVTEVQDKLVQAIQLIQENGLIEKELTLREIYNKYFHPNVLPLNDTQIWNALADVSVLNTFQFDSPVGAQVAKKLKPQTVQEMSAANGLMRLMGEEGEERPLDKYARQKQDITLWYKEMDSFGLTPDEQHTIEPYFKADYGVPPDQESLMLMLMDKNICHFTLSEANAARKVVGKKQMNKIPALRDKVLSQAASPLLGQYIWKYGVGPQMGYSFSRIHALAYSFIGVQTLYIATHWNPIFWNTACLIVNSGSLEDNSEEELVDIYAPEGADLAEGTTFIDLPDKSGKIKKTSSTDYAKIAKAIGDITSKGIKVSLIDINKSSYGFKPDVDNNTILYGLKGLNKVGDPIIEQIFAGRPYLGIGDFMNRCPINKTAMISLIKAGAFDSTDSTWAKEISTEPRIAIMAYYISKTYEKKSKLNLQNFNGLLQNNLIPQSLELQKRVFVFNKFLKDNCKWKNYYVFNPNCSEFYNEFFDVNRLCVIDGVTCIEQNVWEKIYKDCMSVASNYLKEHQKEVLDEYNTLLFKEMWNKYASGTVSAWEMEALTFYYHEHELAHINKEKYGIVNFFDLNEVPEVDYFFKKSGKQIPIYKTYKIMGTVLAKNDTRSSISLLTLDGVVNVKFTKEYYATYNRQLSEVQEDGSKKIVEKGWFTRGSRLMLTGFRRDDQFVTKTYSHTATHQIYLITNIDGQNMEMEHDRG